MSLTRSGLSIRLRDFSAFGCHATSCALVKCDAKFGGYILEAVGNSVLSIFLKRCGRAFNIPRIFEDLQREAGQFGIHDGDGWATVIGDEERFVPGGFDGFRPVLTGV